MNLSAPTRDYLLRLARDSIHAGLAADAPGEPELAGCPGEALARRASFVTLTTGSAALRGCRGLLEPRGPLAADVWHNAWASAFDDPRFAPVTAAEATVLGLEISVLGPLTPVPGTSEAEVRRALVPRRDGVVLGWRAHRATFLPQVWENLPDPAAFLAQLKRKAGLPGEFWAADVTVERYVVETFGSQA